MMKHSTYLQSVRSALFLSVLAMLFSTDLLAKTEEPTLSIPKETPFKPICVGWSRQEGCVETISAALKNAKSNGTIFVRSGSGIADNLEIKKSVTICAASQKDKCLQYPTDEANFRLIRKDETKPCMKIHSSPRPGKVTIRGMEIRDVANPSGPCIVNTRSNASASSVTFDNSVLEDASLLLSGLAKLTVTDTIIDYTFAGDVRPAWTITDVASVNVRDGTSFGGVDLTIANSSAVLSIESFASAALYIDGTGALTLERSNFRRAALAISGSAIRQIEGNRFSDSVISLDHQGLVFFKGNVVETDPYRNPGSDGAALFVAGGVNRISNNHFGSECSGMPSEQDSTCECTLTPALRLASTTMDDRTTRVRDNKVCTNNPVWLGGNIGPDETVGGNCIITYDRKVQSASRKHYRSFKRPPASELIARLFSPGDSWSCQ